MPDSPSGLQIATRIHILLLHEIGQGIDIDQMIRQPRYARDVLLVCDACSGSELMQLAQQFRQVMPPVPPRPAGGDAQRPPGWGRTSTTFDTLRPLETPGEQPFAGRARAWLSRWWHPS